MLVGLMIAPVETMVQTRPSMTTRTRGASACVHHTQHACWAALSRARSLSAQAPIEWLVLARAWRAS